MTLEAVLAAIPRVPILTLVLFLSSEAALCRPEWMNAAVVRRLSRLDLIYGIAAGVLLLSGVARVVWGAKGMGWYVSQPLFHLKVTLFVLAALMSIKPSLDFRRWRKQLHADGSLPPDDAVRRTRRWIMWQSHLIPVIAVIAVFWARGW